MYFWHDLRLIVVKIQHMRQRVLIIFLFLCTFLAGQTPLSFEQCIKLAFENNLELKKQKNNEIRAKYSVSLSKWDMAPSVYAGSSSSIDLRRSTNQNNQIISGKSFSSNMYLNGSLLLFGGLTNLNNIKAQEILQTSVQEHTEALKNSLYLDILIAYSNIVYESENLAVNRKKLEESVIQMDRIKTLVEVGKREPVAIDEIKAVVSGTKLDVLKAENKIKVSLLRLRNLLEYNTSFNIVIDDFKIQFPVEENFSIDQVYQIACSNLPRLKEQETKYEYLKKQLAIRYGKYSPTIAMNGGYSSGYYSNDTLANGLKTPFNTQFNKYLNPSLSLSLNVPIFNGRKKEYDVKYTKLEIEDQLYTISQHKNTIQREIEEALQILTSSKQEFEGANDYLTFVKKSFESSKEKYALGMINSTDFITAQNQMADAQLALMNARLNCIIQERIIKLFMGVRTI